MKKLFLVCLMMLAGSAWAEWMRIGATDSENFFYDPTTIRKDGNIRRVWELRDFGKRNKDGEMSLRARVEYDCKQESYRVLGLSTHSEPMAEGKALYAENRDNIWKVIPPASASEAMFKIVCAK
jgi:hypothetical protein